MRTGLIANWARIMCLAAAWLFLVGVPLQVFLAGLGLFESRRFWDAHAGLGFMLGILSLIALILALFSRLPRVTVGLAALLVGLNIAEILLLELRRSVPVIAALHTVNAFAIFWVALSLARQALASVREKPESVP